MSRHAYSCWLDSNFYWRLFSILMLHVFSLSRCVWSVFCFVETKLNLLTSLFLRRLKCSVFFVLLFYIFAHLCLVVHCVVVLNFKNKRTISKNRKFTVVVLTCHNSAEVNNNFEIRKGSQNILIAFFELDKVRNTSFHSFKFYTFIKMLSDRTVLTFSMFDRMDHMLEFKPVNCNINLTYCIHTLLHRHSIFCSCLV